MNDMPSTVATVRPGEILVLAYARSLTMAEADRIADWLQPLKARGVEVVILSEVTGMVVTAQPVQIPVHTDRASDG